MWACVIAGWSAEVAAFGMGAYIGMLALVILMIFGSRRMHPFTRLGRARMRWFRQRDHRAIAYMNTGMAPDEALALARREMDEESREALRVLD